MNGSSPCMFSDDHLISHSWSITHVLHVTRFLIFNKSHIFCHQLLSFTRDHWKFSRHKILYYFNKKKVKIKPHTIMLDNNWHVMNLSLSQSYEQPTTRIVSDMALHDKKISPIYIQHMKCQESPPFPKYFTW